LGPSDGISLALDQGQITAKNQGKQSGHAQGHQENARFLSRTF
jgi:flagellar biosynthesis/type III secretory pathway protein FliH